MSAPTLDEGKRHHHHLESARRMSVLGLDHVQKIEDQFWPNCGAPVRQPEE
jgi:hypothetical protein